MILQHLKICNFKNIAEADLDFSPKVNALVGNNGMGKSNLLDAIYFMSFTKSFSGMTDQMLIRRDEMFTMINARYLRHGVADELSLGMARGRRKSLKRQGKEYQRLSEHIGAFPIVISAPQDVDLIRGASDERRRLMDMVISQYDRGYIDALTRYNKALQQRNTMLKMEAEPDPAMMDIWEEQMAAAGERIYAARDAFVRELTPVFQRYYEDISSGHEAVGLEYVSHCQRGPLLDVIRRDRFKDRAVGYSLHGVHRDDLGFTLSGHPIKREGSQGQNKTFVIALKLSQFDFLKRTSSLTTPLLLLDDIFDKLDACRVEKIVDIVSGDNFGQIFITDTNRDHLEQILCNSSHDYKLFHVSDGEISEHDV